jgi:glutamate synthase (NADPH/NADH) large chain
MIDLDPLDDLDTSWLVTAIYRHQSETGSEAAGRVLSDWQYSVRQFVKVMPRDYKRVLAAIAEAEESGVDIDEAIMAAAKA